MKEKMGSMVLIRLVNSGGDRRGARSTVEVAGVVVAL